MSGAAHDQRRTVTAPAGGVGPGGAPSDLRSSSSGGGAAGRAPFDSRSRSSRGFGLGRTTSLGMGMAAPSPGGRMHSRTSSTLSAVEEASLAAAQELASVLNAPPTPGAASWLGGWPFGQAFGQEDYDAPPPPLPPGTLPEVQLSDFSRYLRSIGDRLEGLGRSREASQQRMANALSPEEMRASQGQGLVAAMREVPAAFFQEGFDLDQRQLWEELLQVDSEQARQASLERLSGYLDIVETHLVRETAARTDNFFDASGYVQDVRGSVARLYQEVAALRQQMHGLEQETAAAVATSKQLQQQRSNLTATLDLLRGMEVAAQAQSALQGLLPRSGGVAVDYAGAIDVLEVLQGLLDDEALLALDCFKHLPGQIVETAQAVDDLMSSDFLERTRFPAAAALTGGILDRLRLQVAAQEAAQGPAAPRRRRTSSLSGGAASGGPSRQLSAEESAELAALAAARLEDAGTVERAVAWLERCCGLGSYGNSSSGGGAAAATMAAAAAAAGAAEEEVEVEGLQEVLLPLVIGLRRMGRLGAAMRDLKQADASRLKELLSHVVEGCLDILDPESAPGDSSHLLASHRSLSPGRRDEPDGPAALAARLARLPGQDFQWVLEAVVLASKAYLNHCTAVGQAVQTILAAAKAPKPQLAAVAQEARECCQAAAEAAAGRWSKLLSGRARSGGEGSGGAGPIRLGELQGVLELTDLLASLVERYGVRSVLGLRSALQQLCKAALDALHSRSLSKLATLLEQEQWQAVEVPPQFQQLAAQLEERGAQAGASLPATAAAEAPARGHAAAAAEGNGPGSRRGTADAEAAGAADGSGGGGSGGGDDSGGVPRKFTITPPEGPGPPASAQHPLPQQQQQQQPAANGGAAPAGPAPVLVAGGRGYHVVNTQLLMLSMLSEYLAFRDAVPAFAAEVAQRVLELLKVFNSRTCQLVLGAGAMQVSGLKSITAKHLALSCQCLGAFMALHPSLVAAFTQGVLPPRQNMLVADFGRTLQDYRIHHEEVCTKLVAIMRERLSANIKQLPALAAGWPAGGARGEAPAPSAFATTAAKQLGILSGALSPLLLPEELHSIFGRIGLMFSRTLAEAYELLEPHGDTWEQQLRADMQFLLNCLRQLPMDPAERDSNLERLTQLYDQRFLLGPAAAAAAAAAAAPPLAPPPQLPQRPSQLPSPPDVEHAAPAEQPVAADQRAAAAEEPPRTQDRRGGAAAGPTGAAELAEQAGLAEQAVGQPDAAGPGSEPGQIPAALAAVEDAPGAEVQLQGPRPQQEEHPAQQLEQQPQPPAAASSPAADLPVGQPQQQQQQQQQPHPLWQEPAPAAAAKPGLQQGGDAAPPQQDAAAPSGPP
ncbi:hypothetical protein ABPG75_008302 [Micractinium tetrahymenae]